MARLPDSPPLRARERTSIRYDAVCFFASWQEKQRLWKIGNTSRSNVTPGVPSAKRAAGRSKTAATARRTERPSDRQVNPSLTRVHDGRGAVMGVVLIPP